MNRSNFFSAIATTLLSIMAGSAALADDIDIYYGLPAVPADAPVVMFSLDYRPNLGSSADCSGNKCAAIQQYLPPSGPYTFFDILRASLQATMSPLKNIRVGLMLNHDDTSPDDTTDCANNPVAGCSNGGYIALAPKLFYENDSNNAKADFANFLAAMPTPQGNVSHKYQGKELFFELYRYLTGQDVYNGHVGFSDFSTDPNLNMDVDTPDLMWDRDAEINRGRPIGTGPGTDDDDDVYANNENYKQGTYLSPLEDGGVCTKLYSVNVMFQVSQQEDDSDTAMARSIGNQGMAIANGSSFPEVIQWLNDVDLADGEHGVVDDYKGKQNVTSFFIVDESKINSKTTEYAQAGGTGNPLPLTADPEELVKNLTDIFNQILSVSTTFVAASIPVNVFNRAQVVDNVYLSLFQPDDENRPYWLGNVKKLTIEGLSEGNPQLVDANGALAVAADGRIKHSALTYWTDPGQLPPADTDKGQVDGADGRTVSRGGNGQMTPGFLQDYPGLTNADGARQLYYDNGNALLDFDADTDTANALQATMGEASSAQALETIAWARGLDVQDEDGDASVTDARPWLQGDMLHSQPLPLNYGTRGGYTEQNPAIFLAVASNDGFLRFIRNTDTSGNESGEEVWGFIPQSVMSKLSILKQNAAGIRHPYMFDGSPVAYIGDLNGNGTVDSGEKAFVFAGMRRGGKNYYALDVSDPENPAMLWKIGKNGLFSELGNTFSTPRLILTNEGGTKRPALIFAAGYDFNKDSRGSTGTDDGEGSAIYVVDAETGALIWKAEGGTGTNTANAFYHADLVDSIPSSVAIMDSEGDGVHDRSYVGDTGGNVWRVDMAGTSTAYWKLTKLASLGRHSANPVTKSEDRRFFHRPDIVQSRDEDGPYDAVIITSGDRADPNDVGGVVQNWAFAIKDRRIGAGAGVDTTTTPMSLGDVTDACQQYDEECNVDLTGGWRFQLATQGEKGLATPLTANNVVYFTSFIPGGRSNEGECGPSEGSGRLYAVSLKNGGAKFNYDTTTEGDERYTDLDSAGIPAEVVSLPPKYILRPDLKVEDTGATTRFRTYWFEEENSDL